MNRKMILVMIINAIGIIILFISVYDVRVINGEIIVDRKIEYNINYSEGKIAEADMVFVVSNNSRLGNAIKIYGYINNELFLKERIKSSEFYCRYFFYQKLEAGKYTIRFSLDDGTEIEKTFEVSSNKQWVHLDYYHDAVSSKFIIDAKKALRPVF